LNGGGEFYTLAHLFELMKIADYIARLLYQNECVIVPGLGGFVTNYRSATVHPINHTFNPPSKSILFNSKLTSDDGLLVHNISVSECISYSEAKSAVDQFVQECFFALNSKGKLIFENIGVIRKDFENNLLFDPDTSTNYLEESFGLPIFVSRPILRESIQRRIEKKFIDRKPVPDRDRKSKKVYWVYVVLIPMLFMIGWIVFNNGFNFENAQQSSVLPIADSETLSIDSENVEIDKNTPPVKSLKDLNFEDTETGPETENVNETIPEQEQLELKPQDPKYYIIGGAFRYKENADGLISSLRDRGYDAESAGQNPDGLYMVSYFNSEDKSEALVNLAMIRKDSNPSAWLLKK